MFTDPRPVFPVRRFDLAADDLQKLSASLERLASACRDVLDDAGER